MGSAGALLMRDVLLTRLSIFTILYATTTGGEGCISTIFVNVLWITRCMGDERTWGWLHIRMARLTVVTP